MSGRVPWNYKYPDGGGPEGWLQPLVRYIHTHTCVFLKYACIYFTVGRCYLDVCQHHLIIRLIVTPLMHLQHVLPCHYYIQTFGSTATYEIVDAKRGEVIQGSGFAHQEVDNNL